MDTASPESSLTKSLANNYAYSSLRLGKERKRLLKEDFLIRGYNRRVVVIVGSGASVDAGLPGTQELMAKLRTRNFPLSQVVVKKELDRLESVHKLGRKQFETYLLAMSATEHSGKIVRDKLVRFCSRRYLTTLPYELLAHLLKHKFVDAILSFNFDELLDQAISDELNPGEYHYILSDGDCPPFPLPQQRNVLEKPFYIKPHGTVRHSSTLRFTRDDYYRLPIGIQRLMRELLCTRPIDLISIGFNMQSFEFNQILRRVLPESHIFYVNIEQPQPDPQLKLPNRNSHLIPVEKKPEALGKTLKNIVENAYGCFREPYIPRRIQRHELLAKLFENEKRIRRDNPNYLWDRTVVELALAIAKAKGFVTMSVLSCGRAGKYYREYQGAVKTRTKSFPELCKALGLNDVAYGFDALRLSSSKLHPEILSKSEFDTGMNSFLDRVKSQLRKSRKQSFQRHRNQFKETLEMHYGGAEVEVRARPQILHDGLFQTPEVIRSKAALDCKTVELLESSKWVNLLLVSETGEWLTQDRIKEAISIETHPERKIYLVVADKSHSDDVCGSYPGQVAIQKMYWWDHNRHLTLFLDKTGNVMHSIYFTRQRRATDIVPVFLNRLDSQIVFEFWKAYSIRAKERGVLIDRERIEQFKFPGIPSQKQCLRYCATTD